MPEPSGFEKPGKSKTLTLPWSANAQAVPVVTLAHSSNSVGTIIHRCPFMRIGTSVDDTGQRRNSTAIHTNRFHGGHTLEAPDQPRTQNTHRCEGESDRERCSTKVKTHAQCWSQRCRTCTWRGQVQAVCVTNSALTKQNTPNTTTIDLETKYIKCIKS